jgi:hypothetical protein
MGLQVITDVAQVFIGMRELDGTADQNGTFADFI